MAEKSLTVDLVAISVSNLRGFRDARLRMREGLTLLVGPNNAGKTSVLRILDWVLNLADESVLTGDRDLSGEEFALLVPARKTGQRARRISLDVWIPDGRHARRFHAAEGRTVIRIGVSAAGQARLNIGPPRRGEETDRGPALELLRALRRCTRYDLIPASRDASSESFNTSFRSAVTALLEERAIHDRQAGAPAEYRQIKKSLAELERVGTKLVAPLWERMSSTLPPGLAQRGTLSVSVSPEAFVPWLAEHASLRLVTGEHDADSVLPIEVGSGLQSLLDLATQQASVSHSEATTITAVEEPEAYLHPSAQRTLARVIAQRLPGKRIVSTHSPLLVEEASYGEVVLVRDHRFFEPADRAQDDPVRHSINTVLLSGFGAEMAFAHAVLLVEGDGDRLYFEALRRRIAGVSKNGEVDRLYVVPTGGKAAFSPWLRLLSSYGRYDDRPVAWLAVPDSDAATEIRRAWDDAVLALSPEVTGALGALAETPREDEARVSSATAVVNKETRSAGVGLALLPNGLESVMLANCGSETISRLCSLVGAPEYDRDNLTKWLRKKHNKAPWMRAAIGRETPWRELSPDAVAILRRWLSTVVPSTREVHRLLTEAD
jgi:hypothetical protein